MYFLEVFFILVVTGFLITQNIRGFERKYIRTFFWLGWTIFLLSMVLMQGHYRWQMLPAHLVFFILHILLAKHSSSHIFFRSVGLILGSVLILLAAFLSFALPTVDLPAPNGPYTVGSSTFTLIDGSRNNAAFAKLDEQRELGIQVWYPGILDEDEAEPELRSMWEELYRAEGLNWVKFFTNYLYQVKTHSYKDIPISNEQTAYPLVIFSHGIGITSEFSSLLLEHLASHGYIVVAVNHTYISLLVNSSKGGLIYADFKILNKISADNDIITEIIQGTKDSSNHKEQIVLLQQAYQQMDVLPSLMDTGINDLKFVLDEIVSMASANSKMQEFNERINTNQIGVMGVSSGGSMTTELCRTDSRCLAGINLDGGVISENLNQALKVPFLVMSRPFTSELIGFLLPESKHDYFEIVTNDITHGHFTDMPALTPLFRMNQIQQQFTNILNTTTQAFFDAYLINDTKPNLELDEFYEEISIKTNLP